MLLKVPTLIIPLNIGKYAPENGPTRATRHFSVSEITERSVSGKSTKFKKLLITFLGKSAKF